ncbi:hypothetical protein [Guptibacillus hwajinpoensis]|uniref:hypothetical protein n=1 Tax=Guptibacillus hwajinpoensis TaxID=208199 RepID=UPI0037356515
MENQVFVHNGDIENYLTQEQLIQYDEQRINYYLEKQQYEEEQWLDENGYTVQPKKKAPKKAINKIEKVGNILGVRKKGDSVIQLHNEIVRNDGYSLNAKDFVTVGFLKKYYYLNGFNEVIPLDHRKLMANIAVNDTRTFKKILHSLYVNNILKEKVERLPTKGNIELVINPDVFEQREKFTQLRTDLFNFVADVGHIGVHLLYYYESFINKSNGFAFPGFEKICNDLKITDKTLDKFNKRLVKQKLLKIEKHKLEWQGYNDNNAMIYDKYQNHYYVLV